MSNEAYKELAYSSSIQIVDSLVAECSHDLLEYAGHELVDSTAILQKTARFLIASQNVPKNEYNLYESPSLLCVQKTRYYDEHKPDVFKIEYMDISCQLENPTLRLLNATQREGAPEIFVTGTSVKNYSEMNPLSDPIEAMKVYQQNVEIGLLNSLGLLIPITMNDVQAMYALSLQLKSY